MFLHFPLKVEKAAKEEVEFRREAVEDGARLGRVHSSTVRAGDS